MQSDLTERLNDQEMVTKHGEKKIINLNNTLLFKYSDSMSAER
jgi:hypothetical protein